MFQVLEYFDDPYWTEQGDLISSGPCKTVHYLITGNGFDQVCFSWLDAIKTFNQMVEDI